VTVDGRHIVIFPARPPRQRKRDTAFILGIPKGTTPNDLKAAFAAYNPTVARIIHEKDSERRGFAFVTFATEEDQAKAVSDHRDSGIRLKGEISTVRFARPLIRRRRPYPFRRPRPEDNPGGRRSPRGGRSARGADPPPAAEPAEADAP
jgi:RNA recognition motif-containing protein